MASATAIEGDGLPLEGEVDEQEDFAEFRDIQRALAEESGQEIEVEEEPDVASLVNEGLDSGLLEAERTAELSEEEAHKPPKQTRADKRIQKLISEKKALQKASQERDTYYRQQLQGVQDNLAQQRAADSKSMQEQLGLQRQQLALLQQNKAAETESNLSPMEQYRRQIIREAGETAKGAFSPEVEALRGEIQALKEQRQQEVEEAKQRDRYNHYNSQTMQVRDGMLKGFLPDRAKQLADPMDEMLLAFCGAYGVDPQSAGPRFKKYLDTYVQGVLETRAKGGQKIRKSQGVPRSAPSGKRAVRGSGSWPTPDTLRKAGFDSALDWVAAGEPPVG